jgi:hypothetical protein
MAHVPLQRAGGCAGVVEARAADHRQGRDDQRQHVHAPACHRHQNSVPQNEIRATAVTIRFNSSTGSSRALRASDRRAGREAEDYREARGAEAKPILKDG